MKRKVKVTRKNITYKFDDAKKKKNQEIKKDFYYSGNISLHDFAKETNISGKDIILYFFYKKQVVNLNTILDEDKLKDLCENFKIKFLKKDLDKDAFSEYFSLTNENSKLKKRPPVVTIMGHVDHGKTTLLDIIRKTNVVGSEFGGITQHIGAYQINFKNEKITFIDTPGHESFSEMRAHGAKITDIIVLVVAANDGFKKQTIESIQLAKASNIPVIVAINKIDLNDKNFDPIFQSLEQHGYLVEEWGGDTIVVPISAKNNVNIELLLGNIVLLSEILNLTADYEKNPTGVVIESFMDSKVGSTATLLIQAGVLKKNQYIVFNKTYSKIKQMKNQLGQLVQIAEPSCPVQVYGFSEVPEVASKFVAFDNEKDAKILAQKITDGTISHLQETFSDANKSNFINVIVKSDVKGSLEALKSIILKFNDQEHKLKIIRDDTGEINKNDVMMAFITKAIIVGFNVRCASEIINLIKEKKIPYIQDNIIYRIEEQIKLYLDSKIIKEKEEILIGEAQVRKVFKTKKYGTIAGIYVRTGFIKADSIVVIFRNNAQIYKTKLNSLKHFEKNVNEVKAGLECGVTLANFNDIKVDDIFQIYNLSQ
ncbi:translation initiation factor IF-2 [symbiont of Argiope bruennichi]|uniref:translation initiation factor IF-2 n=1 Tax=symbiont of Argiope bruennichi TaxID=2810479 RepID=UPI003DA51CCD